MDVYLDDSTHDWEKVGTAVACSNEGVFTEGYIVLRQYGNETNDQISHVDYAKMYTGLFVPVGNLQCYSEDSIINQGTYSLKAIATITDSLNDTLTKSGLSIDLSGVDTRKYHIYSASRTVSQIKISIHDW